MKASSADLPAHVQGQGNENLCKAPALAACLMVPWLNPFAPGPSAAIAPWLVTLACIGVLSLLIPPSRPSAWGCVLWLGMVLLFWLPRASASGDAAPELLAATLALAAMALCALVGMTVRRDLQTMEVLAWAWLAAALISALIALCQYFGVAGRFSPWMSVSTVGDAFANLRQRNQFATLTNIGMLALTWLMTRRSLAHHAPWMVLLLAVGNAASGSRTGLLQLLVLIGLACLWPAPQRKRNIQLCVGALLIHGMASMLLPALSEVLSAASGVSVLSRIGQEEGCGSRSVLWTNIVELIGLKPWLGWGWGELDFAHYMTPYHGERFCDILDNAHDLPLHLAVELGIPAALLLCLPPLWWVVRARPWREPDSARQLAWGVIGMILLHSLLEYPLWYGPFQMAFGLCWGMLVPTQRTQPPAAPQTFWSRMPGMFMLLLVFYVSVQYHRVGQIYLPARERDAGWQTDTLSKLRDAHLFRAQARFAELTTTPLTPENAPHLHAVALEMLHFSPEPRVIEKLIESDVMLGLDDEALVQLDRFRTAFPKDYRKWSEANHSAKVPARRAAGS